MTVHMPPAVGLDFGTTNTSIAVSRDGQTPVLVEFPSAAGMTETFRSVLFFEPTPAGDPVVTTGPEAIDAHLDPDIKGRLIQSLKSYLAEPSFRSTNVFGKNFQLEHLLAIMIRHVRARAEEVFGDLGDTVVAGRPVRFVGGDGEQTDELATGRLRKALALAGFTNVRFEYEPVAAAHDYRTQLIESELSLIADFGGGTTDLSLVALKPMTDDRAADGVEVIATAGVGIAGDCFDGRIVQQAVSPALGSGLVFRSHFGKELPIPAWLYTHLRRWHHVSFLRTKKTLDVLEELIRSADTGRPLEDLRHLIEEDLGFALHQAVQETKFRLSEETETAFRFSEGPIQIHESLGRPAFDTWIEPDLTAIRRAVDLALERGAVRPDQVSTVFLTGGSSFVPAVRQLFVDRFGVEKVRGGRELTTVATGLARIAASAQSTE